MWTVLHQSQVDSTNSWAKRFALEHPEACRVLFRADTQTAGRGRLGRSWWSPSGGLWVSLLLRPCRLTAFSLVFGLWCAELLQQQGVLAQVRWPNDLYVQDKKLGGILIESVSCGASQGFAVVGVGLNVDRQRQAPDCVDRPWTACRAWQKNFDPEGFITCLMTKVDRELPDFERLGWSHYRMRFDKVDALLGKNVRVQQGAKHIAGVVVGLDEEGCLTLDTGDALWNIDRLWVLDS